MRRIAFVLVGLLTGCASEAELPPPTLMLEVDPGTVAMGGVVTITSTVDNFTLGTEALEATTVVPRSAQHEGGGEADVPRTGHVHVYLDNLEGNPIVTITDEVTEVQIDAEPGEHDLIGRLHGTDHKIIEPQVTDTVALTVTAP